MGPIHVWRSPVIAGRAASAAQLAAATLLAVLVQASAVSAGQPSREDQAAAEALFLQGGKLKAQGKIEEACNKWAASQRLDPAVGTLLFLGDCYEALGRTASAWATFTEAS